MNLTILSAEIVRRVHGSPDCAINLEVMVAGLIREEIKRSTDASNAVNREFKERFSKEIERQHTPK